MREPAPAPAPMIHTLSASVARQQWSQLINRVFRGQSRYLVEKSGIPVAAVVSAQDLERLTRYDEERAKGFAALDRIGEAFKDVPEDEMDTEIARAIAEVRAERRGAPMTTEARHTT